MLKEWLDNGVLSEAACKTPSRNEGIKTVVNEVKIAGDSGLPRRSRMTVSHLRTNYA